MSESWAKKMRIVVIIGLLLGLIGCAEDLTCEELAEFEPAVELGHGQLFFNSIDDSETQLQTHRGGQGGQHVYVAAKFRNMKFDGEASSSEELSAAPATSVVVFSLVSGEELLGQTTIHEAPSGDSSGSKLIGLAMPVMYSTLSEFTLVVEAVDSCGNLATDARAVSLAD